MHGRYISTESLRLNVDKYNNYVSYKPGLNIVKGGEVENTQSRNLRITALRRCAVGNPWLAKSATLMLADIQVKLVTDETFGIKTASTSIAYMGRDYPYKYKRLEPTPAGPLLVLAVDASDAPYDVLEFYTDMVIKSPPGKEAEQVADPRED